VITTTAKLRLAIKSASREDLENLAYDVVWALYATCYIPEDDLITPEEAAELGVAPEDVILNSEKEWETDEIEEVAAAVSQASLNPEDIK
jgi:hypothetical protein